MTSSPTTNTGLEKQGSGDNISTWGTTNLNRLFDKVDGYRGRASINLAGLSSYTLTSVNYLTDERSKGILVFTGILTSNVQVNLPNVDGNWDVDNQCSMGSFTITLGPLGGAGVSLLPGTARIYSDGSTAKYIRQTDFGNNPITGVTTLAVAGKISGVATGSAGTDAVNVAQMGAAIASAALPATSGTVLNSIVDTSAGFLDSKITGATGVSLSTINPGANENLQIAVNVPAALGYTPANKAGDTLTGALNSAAPVAIASASSVAIGAAASNEITISGTTTITSFDAIAAGAERIVTFSGALTLTHNATSLILPGAANITTAAGDVAWFVSLGSGNWRCLNYMRASGQPVSPVDTAISAAISAGAVTLNLASGGLFYTSLNANITSITISTPAASGLVSSFTWELIADGTARSITWPASVKWDGGVAPTLTSTNTKKDVFTFYTRDGGSTYMGFVSGQSK